MSDEERRRRVEELFHQGLELDPSALEEFLAESTAGDEDLAAEVRELLGHGHPRTETVLSLGAYPRPEAEPERVGRYRLIELLGEGGMGTVHLAEQEEPVHRRVALKMIRLGSHTEEVAGRFAAERQTLALLEHPGIARIYDGGVTESGLPFFVMEYVPGKNLVDHARRHGLTIDERLALFEPVCDAVQYAHQKGVLHRDLKPSNVLVTERDGHYVPKIIDFGVARALGDPELGVAGTWIYMSPEQADPAGPAIDARSDIYSLGVMLVELLTGELPYGPGELDNDDLAESVRRSHTREPFPPSRLTRDRGTARELRGDLDWILMKALARDPGERYASASELRADIERHRDNEPVEAGPADTLYLATKFARRHRLGVVAALIIVVSLVVALFSARAGRDAALAAADERSYERAKAEAVVEFFRAALLQAGPQGAGSEAVDLLRRTLPSVDLLNANEPLMQAAVHYFVGRTLLEMGQPEHAAGELRRAYNAQIDTLGAEHYDVFLTLSSLVAANRRASGPEAAAPWIEKALAAGEALLRESRPELRDAVRAMRAMQRLSETENVGPETFSLLGQLLDALPDVRRSGDETAVLGRLVLEAGGVLLDRDDPRAGEFLDQIEAKARLLLGPPSFSWLSFLWILTSARLVPEQGDFASAERLARELVEQGDETLPPDHWLRIDGRRLLGLAQAGLGDFVGAEANIVAAHDQVMELQGVSKSVARPMNDALTSLAVRFGADDTRASWERWRASDGAAWPEARSWWIVSSPSVPRGTVAFAREVLEDALEADPEDGPARSHLAMALYRLGDFQGALSELDRAAGSGGTAERAIEALALARVGRVAEAREVWAARTVGDHVTDPELLDEVESTLAPR